MKKTFFLLSGVLLIAMLSLVLSCNSDGYSEEVQSTEADLFIASPQYQKLSKESEVFQINVVKIFSKLSKEEQAEVIRICKEILKSKNHEQKTILLKDLLTLTNIDYLGYAQKISDLSKETFEGTNFTSQEFIKALQKQKVRNVAIPRTKNTSESGDNKTKLEACLKGCTFSRESALLLCGRTHEHHSNDELNKCIADISLAESLCIIKCKELYPIKNN